jgi:hypothetical protein
MESLLPGSKLKCETPQLAKQFGETASIDDGMQITLSCGQNKNALSPRMASFETSSNARCESW